MCELPPPEYFIASDGYRLAFRRYRPARPPRGAVVALHGIQSHSGWYGFSCDRIRQAGYEVFFPDRRGSGENGTQRGHTPAAGRLINDVAQFLRFVQADTACLPTLWGMSWGGKLAVTTAAQHQNLMQNLVLSYPGLCPRVRPAWWQRAVLNVASRTRRAHKRLPIPLSDPALFTDSTRWQTFIRSDPLALHRVSAAFLHASVVLDRSIPAAARRIDAPTLTMLSGQDRIIDNEATKVLIRQFPCSDRTIHEYPDARHTLEFETNREEIVSELILWLNAH